ncbi:MAG: hypothetical protein ABSC05_28295 [Candidatus Solibacter sp.]|jgi:hypothetical protein
MCPSARKNFSAQPEVEIDRRSMLSELANGGVPRSAMGLNPITDIATAPVATQFVLAISTPGLTAACGRFGLP